MQIIASPNSKWDDQLDVIAIPGEDEVEIEVAVELKAIDGSCDLRQAIQALAAQVSGCGDELEGDRWDSDPVTGKAGPVDRMAVVRRIERIVERLAPAGVEVGDVA